MTDYVWLLVLLGVMSIGAVVYLTPQLYRWFQVRRWRSVSNVMALTYDDGPDGVTSLELLNLLSELNVKATFYLVGFRAELARDVVEQIAVAGHELGAHSHLHKNAWKSFPWQDVIDAERGYRTLAPFVANTASYRPPFGKISLFAFISMLAKGRRVEWWTRPTNDSADQFEDPDMVAESIIAEKQPVVLMHSHHAEPHRRQYMLETTRALIQKAKAQNIQLVTMSELDVISRGRLA